MLDSTPAGYFTPTRPRILAHRGLAVDAAENTLRAFRMAESAGAQYLETDVHVSKDGVAVLSHDPDITRLTGRAQRVDELNFLELRQLDLGQGQAFCSLAEALDAFPTMRFNIDVKAIGAAVPTAHAVLDAKAGSRVLISSFSEQRRRRAVDLVPGVATSASSPLLQKVIALSPLGPTNALRSVLRGVQAVQVPERVRFLKIVTPRFVELMHALDVEVHVWTVNEPSDMDRLLDLGVDGIVTDRCDIAAEVVDRRRL